MNEMLVQELLGAAKAAALSIAVLAMTDLLTRTGRLHTEATRKFAHVASGVTLLAMPMFVSSHWTVLALATGFAALMTLTHVSGRLRGVHDVGRGVGGVLWYPFASWVSYVLAFELLGASYAVYAAAVLALALADAAGALVGQRWGAHTYRVAAEHVRSVEGSFAVAAVAMLCTAAVLAADGRSLQEAILVGVTCGIAVAMVEAVCRRGADNVAIPAATIVWADLLMGTSAATQAAAAVAASVLGVTIASRLMGQAPVAASSEVAG